MFKKRYHVQWENGIWESWWTEKTFVFKRSATKYAIRMLTRNSNVAAWRVVQQNKNDYTIIFEGYINRKWRHLERKYLEHFSKEDSDKYYKAPIINGKVQK